MTQITERKKKLQPNDMRPSANLNPLKTVQ